MQTAVYLTRGVRWGGWVGGGQWVEGKQEGLLGCNKCLFVSSHEPSFLQVLLRALELGVMLHVAGRALAIGSGASLVSSACC